MNIISPTAMVRGAAMFLLANVPLDELPDEIAQVTQSFRIGTIDKNAALAYMEQTQKQFISDWIAENERIHKEIGSWGNI